MHQPEVQLDDVLIPDDPQFTGEGEIDGVVPEPPEGTAKTSPSSGLPWEGDPNWTKVLNPPSVIPGVFFSQLCCCLSSTLLPVSIVMIIGSSIPGILYLASVIDAQYAQVLCPTLIGFGIIASGASIFFFFIGVCNRATTMLYLEITLDDHQVPLLQERRLTIYRNSPCGRCLDKQKVSFRHITKFKVRAHRVDARSLVDDGRRLQLVVRLHGGRERVITFSDAREKSQWKMGEVREELESIRIAYCKMRENASGAHHGHNTRRSKK